MTIAQLRAALSALPRMDRHSLADAGILVSREEWFTLCANPVRWALSLDPVRFDQLCDVLHALEPITFPVAIQP